MSRRLRFPVALFIALLGHLVLFALFPNWTPPDRSSAEDRYPGVTLSVELLAAPSSGPEPATNPPRETASASRPQPMPDEQRVRPSHSPAPGPSRPALDLSMPSAVLNGEALDQPGDVVSQFHPALAQRLQDRRETVDKQALNARIRRQRFGHSAEEYAHAVDDHSQAQKVNGRCFELRSDLPGQPGESRWWMSGCRDSGVRRQWFERDTIPDHLLR